MAKVNAQYIKPPRALTYPYHVYRFIGHKLTTCRTFNEVQKLIMFIDSLGIS